MISRYLYNTTVEELPELIRLLNEHFNMNDVKAVVLGPLSKQFAYGILWNVIAECVGINLYSYQDFITIASEIECSNEIYDKIENDRMNGSLKEPLEYFHERIEVYASTVGVVRIEIVNRIIRDYLYLCGYELLVNESYVHNSPLYQKCDRMYDFLKRFDKNKLLHDPACIDVFALELYRGFISQLLSNGAQLINRDMYAKEKYLITDSLIMNGVSKYATDTFKSYIACGYVRINDSKDFDYAGFLNGGGLYKILSAIASENILNINKMRDHAMWVYNISEFKHGLFKRNVLNDKSVQKNISAIRYEVERKLLKHHCTHLIVAYTFISDEKRRNKVQK